MKYAFISDIHGNATALQAVLKDIEKRKTDKIVVLGDLCYRGPEPRKALNLVRSLNTEVIKGNADEWVIRGVKNGEVPDTALELMNKERDWTVSQLTNSDIDYLESLPHSFQLQAENFIIKGFHATPDSLFEVVLPYSTDEVMLEKMMSSDGQVFVYGHIHTPFVRYIMGKIIVNTGSVGLPFDGLPKASYALVEVESGKIRTSIERVDYNISEVVDLYQEVQYPNQEMMIKLIKNGGF